MNIPLFKLGGRSALSFFVRQAVSDIATIVRLSTVLSNERLVVMLSFTINAATEPWHTKFLREHGSANIKTPWCMLL